MERAMAQTEIKLTVDDYRLFPDDGQRHELVDGEHVVTPAPRMAHQRTVGKLFLALHAAAVAQGAGEVILSPMDVILSHHDVLQPDVLYVSDARSAIVQDWVRGAPDLAVEVLSPSSRRIDDVLKRRRYEAFGVDELWIVDPEVEVVRVYRREGERFERPQELSAERGDVVTTMLLPQLRLEVASLFARR
jgi:Uma2 family endonuclease